MLSPLSHSSEPLIICKYTNHILTPSFIHFHDTLLSKDVNTTWCVLLFVNSIHKIRQVTTSFHSMISFLPELFYNHRMISFLSLYHLEIPHKNKHENISEDQEIKGKMIQRWISSSSYYNRPIDCLTLLHHQMPHSFYTHPIKIIIIIISTPNDDPNHPHHQIWITAIFSSLCLPSLYLDIYDTSSQYQYYL